MTDPAFKQLLGAASKPPEAPIDRFIAAIPANERGGFGQRRVMAGLLVAVCVAALAGGAVMFGLVPERSPTVQPVPSAGLVASVSDDDAFAAALSGELALEEFAP